MRPIDALAPVVILAGSLLGGCTGGVGSGTSSDGPTASTTAGAEGSPSMTATEPPDGSIRYVALGDSYTVGTGVERRERWPNQLVRALRPQVDIELVDNLGVNGATSGDVIEDQLPRLEELDPGFVTLLVGVNDVVRRVAPERYRANLGTILDAVLALVPPGRVLVVTTPDYTLTQHGSDYGDPEQQRAEIARANDLLRDAAAVRGITVVDIAPVSDLVPLDPSLVAGDGLHPSGKQYAGWVELMAPTIRELLDPGPTAAPAT